MNKNFSGIKQKYSHSTGWLISLIKVYQNTLGLLLPDTCRFTPTCSEYMIQALRQFGILRGGLMGFLRILRCNPFSSGGYDPVDRTERIESNGK